MKNKSKHILYETAREFFEKLHSQGKIIVQCHGTFDLIHPGHIVHFEEAKRLGDVLVITVTGEKHVNKGPGRPYFNDDLRVKSIAALEVVDYVVVIPYSAAVEAIECVKPNFYCKGKEYENVENDPTGNILDDVMTVEKYGGKMAYVGSAVFSSTKLLNSNFDLYPAAVSSFCKKFSQKYSPEDFRNAVESFSDLKVLVLGDIIFDRYTTVNVQGLTSKNRILSVRYVSDQMQAGGSLAVFRHIKEFTPNVKIMSLVGTESWVEEELCKCIETGHDEIIRVPHFTTIVKHRYVEPLAEGKELIKLFSVNFIDKNPQSEIIEKAVIDKLDSMIDDFDLVMVADFGHGLMQEKVRRFVEKRAKFMALNCQTNSYNYGFNIINRQYQRADSFSLDQAEITLASGKKNIDLSNELKNLFIQFKSKYGWLTRGAVETIGTKKNGSICLCPPLEYKIVDPVGAGDAFSALASLSAVKGLPLEMATFMGQLAGAEAVKIVGNIESIKKSRIIKGGMAMLSF